MASKILKQYFYRLFRSDVAKKSPCDANCRKMYKTGVDPLHFVPPQCSHCGASFKFELLRSEESEISVSYDADPGD